MDKAVIPFLKWAGGKRWLTKKHNGLFPSEYNSYYEPFVGGGATLFHLQPKCGVISDCNSNLIETYQAIKYEWEDVVEKLKLHHEKHSKDYYYKIRASKPRSRPSRAARFIYLNRTCWNGLYRVNLKGGFNVPIGTKTNVILDTDNFKGVSKLLQKIEIKHCDYSESIDMSTKDDFIFADPPYTVKHNKNNFVKYNEELFHWDEQVKLRDSIVSASNRGVKVMVTNAAHEAVIDLYKSNFDIKTLSRKSVIAASSSKRGNYEEIIITNY